MVLHKILQKTLHLFNSYVNLNRTLHVYHCKSRDHEIKIDCTRNINS